MAYILDGAAILIFVVCLLRGWRKGSVRTIVKLVGCVLALILAGRFSTPVTEFVYEKAVQPTVENALVKKVQEEGGLKFDLDLSTVVKNGALSPYLSELDLPEKVTLGFKDLSEETVRDTLSPAIESYVRPPLIRLVQALVAVLLFAIFYIAVCVLARMADTVFKLPLLKELNHLTGLIVGLLEGVVWVLVFVAALRLMADWRVLGDNLTSETIESTRLISRLSIIRILF